MNKNNKKRAFLDWAPKALAITTPAVAIFTYAFLTMLNMGYLGEFGVDIQAVGYWPSLFDFVFYAFIGIVSLAIGVLFYWGISRIAVFIGRKISKKKGFFGAMGRFLSSMNNWFIPGANTPTVRSGLHARP